MLIPIFTKDRIDILFDLYIKTGHIKTFIKQGLKLNPGYERLDFSESDLTVIWLAFDRAAEEWADI